MIRILAPLLAVATLAACTDAQTRKTVKVEIATWGGTASATGSHIGDGLILTNKHVCDVMALPGARSQVLPYKGRRLNVFGYYMSERAGVDLCLLKTNAWFLPKIEIANKAESYVGQLVQVVGYPAGNYMLSKGYVRGTQIFEVFDGKGINMEFLTVIEMIITGGSSGSSVINDKGELIGVISAGGGPIALFVPLSAVKEFLQDAIPYFKN